jgi:hypothetical protein
MKSILSAMLLLGAVVLLAAPVLAQVPKGGKTSSPPPAKAGEVKKGDAAGATKTFDFEGDIVEAQFLRPDQGVAEVVRLDEGPSLIKVRTDFVDEILKSAEDL